MKQLTMEEVIDKAIAQEEESWALYEKLTGVVQDAASRDTLHFMAGEALKHKVALQRYKSGEMGKAVLPMKTVADARVVEALGEPDMSGTLQNKDIFLFAAGREKATAARAVPAPAAPGTPAGPPFCSVATSRLDPRAARICRPAAVNFVILPHLCFP